MWALTQGSNAINIDKLDRINVVQRGAVWLLEFQLNSHTSHLKGSWATEALARAALVAITGAIDTAL